MQQAIPPRFRDSTSNLSGNGDRRSTVAFSPSDHLDNIFQAVRQQVDRWGENAKWKIELILLSEPTSSSSTKTSLPPMHPEQQVFDLARPIKPHQVQSDCVTRKPETWSMPYAADLQHNLRSALERQRYLESVVRAQDERIRQLQANTALNTIQNIHTMTMNELKEQHRIEIKLLQKENQTLAKKFMRMSSTLQRIEKMGLTPEDAQLDRKDLMEDRKVLLRKLHLSELRLRARDAELRYLHNLAWSHRQSDTDENDQRSPYLLQKQYSPTAQPTRPLSALDSLSMLADQMLSDPDFGSEGKESSASPDTRFVDTKSFKRTSYDYPIKKEEDVDGPIHVLSKRKRQDDDFGESSFRKSHQLSNERPSSAFHTFVPIQHAQAKHTPGPISIISRKDHPNSTANTLPTLMSPVPSSYRESSRK
ncbi:hypothetical protein BJV82DRAFT_219291 [Fennellomyces sp. T-0311]|nr:hypothetical protein BJV82DRAFT_219291 [Fennellomyces sp. T-0311]